MKPASQGEAPDLERLAALLPRYDIAGPRYTSYPTAPMWNDAFGPDAFGAALARVEASPDSGVALYVHIPFCSSLCHFCACTRVITRDASLPEQYLEALARELDAVRAHLPGVVRVDQIHLGGGTPTHLSPEQLRRLMSILDGAFTRGPDAELSIEVDPRVTTRAHIDTLYELGFRRISLGVQDFDPRVQKAIHRIQPVSMVAELTEAARARGFESVNFDLIYGLPFQTVESFDSTLDALFSLSPDRVALYSYAHVTWVAKQQRGFERIDLPDAERKLEIMLHAIRRFLAEGYEQLGMDHFARPEDDLALARRSGTLHRNFMGYTTRVCEDMIALGPSAISRCGDAYAQSRRDLRDWMDTVSKGGLATFRGHRLDEEDERRGWVIEEIMCAGRVEVADYHKRFGRDFARDFALELEAFPPFVEDGLVERAGDGSLRATPTGTLLLRNLAMPFDGYLDQEAEPSKPMFSRTV